jgi:hypothetical protein
MSDAERLAMWIAICKTCLLADVMKDCAHCQFNVGLEPVVVGETMRILGSSVCKKLTLDKT